MHLPKTIQTNVEIIGHHDNTPLHRWSEGDRTFEEFWATFTAPSGTTYGLVNVREITA